MHMIVITCHQVSIENDLHLDDINGKRALKSQKNDDDDDDYDDDEEGGDGGDNGNDDVRS